MNSTATHTVLFVQNLTHRAGAQTCLVRMLSQDVLRMRRPVILCSSPGWLTEECDRRAIKYFVVPFPRSRSLLARVHQNSQFVRTVKRKLDESDIQPAIVHANDHWEGILGIRLAKALSARSALFLRTSRITRDQYFKYSCDRYDAIAAVGPALQSRVQDWTHDQKIELIHDGIERNEFLAPKQRASTAPRRILVIGATRRSKGWADLVDALAMLERRGLRLVDQVDFTGERPSRSENDLKTADAPRVRFNFLGRVNDFRDLVRQYDLVINSSRSDSFGMAAIETLAAGVPILASRTGVMEQVVPFDHLLFPPRQPEAMAEALQRLLNGWSRLDLGVAQAQELIRRKFGIEQSAAALDSLYDRLTAGPDARSV